MSSVLDFQHKMQDLESNYQKSIITKEEYIELLNDLKSSEVIAETARDLEDLSRLNSNINDTIAILKAVV
jgi:cell division protein FtsL